MHWILIFSFPWFTYFRRTKFWYFRFHDLRIFNAPNSITFVFFVIFVVPAIPLWLLPFTLNFHAKSRTCLVILLEHFVVVAPDAGSWTRLTHSEIFIILVISGYEEYPTNEQIQIKRNQFITNLFSSNITWNRFEVQRLKEFSFCN